MSGIAGSEVFLLIIIGLVVLGPKRLPQVANQIGSWLGQARRMTRMMKRQLEDEINVDLNSINVKQQLGLDDKPQSNPVSSAGRGAVTTPTYVQDRHKAKASDDVDTTSSKELASENDVETDELPDDYSPAHGVDDAGTGVGDDEHLVASTDANDAPDNTTETTEESAAAAAAVDKKETA